MGKIFRFAKILSLLSVLVLVGCGTPPPDATAPVAQADISALTQSIMALGPDIDPDEAARAARISYLYSRQLRKEYGVTDPPLIHNTKVNMGLRPRGLCYQWADDIEARLKQENFTTLALHRAIANATNIRIEHSTTIVSRRGEAMEDGIILDPWRFGGALFWARVPEDDKYIWVQRQDVFEMKRRRAERTG